MADLILIIRDEGDPTVGIFPNTYEILCPFDNSADISERALFSEHIKTIYGEWANGKLISWYSDETEDHQTMLSQHGNEADEFEL